MRWLTGGWQRAEPATVRAASPVDETRPYDSPQEPPPVMRLDSRARDIDVSGSIFRNLLVGGGITGFGTVLCAASIAESGGGLWLWFWQLVFAACFIWFVSGARGVFTGRGFMVDRNGLYVRAGGDIFGVPWNEIEAVGVGSLPWVHNRRPVHPARRQAFEFFPAGHGFAARHPELERWLVRDTPPSRGLPSARYRFFLPPLSRLPRRLESAVQSAAGRKWLGHYRRDLPHPRS